MTTFDMTAINQAPLDVAAYPAPAVDAIALIQQPVGTATVQGLAGPTPFTRLDEPSSLVLALIGVATLAAYRGIVERLTARPAAKPAPRPLVKPRRRAA